MDTSPLLPGLRIPTITGIVMAEAGEFEDGDGARATLTANALVVEMRVDGNEGSLVVPILALLEAIQEQNHKYGS